MLPLWFVEQRGGRKEQEELQKLVYTLEETGHDVHIARYKPFGAMEFKLPQDRPVILQGSIQLGDTFNAKVTDVYPGVWMNMEILKCSFYYWKLGKFLLTPYYGFYPLGELLRLKDALFTLYSEPGDTPSLGRLLFIRPDTNDKVFPGEVLGPRYFESWLRSIEASGRLMCVVSPFVKIEEEYRLVIADGKPIAGSKYKENDYIVYEQGFPDDVGELATEIAKTWSPHPVWVLDIARSQGVPKLLELGGVNCAGWYHCDLKAVISAMDAAAIRDWENKHSTEEDSNEVLARMSSTGGEGTDQLPG
jgi:hypothetical protein